MLAKFYVGIHKSAVKTQAINDELHHAYYWHTAIMQSYSIWYLSKIIVIRRHAMSRRGSVYRRDPWRSYSETAEARGIARDVHNIYHTYT